MLNNIELSSRVKSIPQALSVYINQIVYDLKRRNIDLTVLSLGEAFFNMPDLDFNDTDIEKGYHYSDSLGLLSLRKKIANYYNCSYDVPVDANKEIMISAGSKPIIFMCLLACLEQGDEVLIYEPAWLSYQEQVKLAGGVAKFIPYTCNISEIKNFISTKTKLLIINNPNNPIGKNYTREEIEKISQICEECGIFLLVDEAYSDFVINKEFVSAGSIFQDKSNLFIVNSLSKNFGISGWRIGYVISAEKNIRELLKLNQHLITCAPTQLMMYIDKHFEYLLKSTLPQAIAVARKRNTIVDIINNKGLSVLPGTSTFYVFLDVSKYKGNTLDLCYTLLLKYGIATIPGGAYGESTKKYLRLSVGTECTERIEAALEIIKDCIYLSPLNSCDLKMLFTNLDLEYINWNQYTATVLNN